jgi:hypothetical protein
VQRVETNETAVSRKEEVGIRTSQARKGIERCTIDSHEDGGGITRLGEEFNPVDIVVIGHDPLNYTSSPHSFAPFILERRLRKKCYQHVNERRGWKDKRTNRGSANTSGALTGRLGSESNQITLLEGLMASY